MKGKNIFFVILISVSLIVLFSTHEALSIKLVSKTEPPEEYTVVKRDTLWDISERKLDDPFLWPRLWNVNPHIENPDLIYPGTVILIPSREELMRMPMFPVSKQPPMPQEEPVEAVMEMPEKIIDRYLVSRNLFIASGWIDDEYHKVGSVIDAPDNLEISGKENTVYIELDKNKNFPVNLSIPDKPLDDQKFFTIRDIKIVRHPETSKVIGHQIRVTGIVRLYGKDNNMLKAEVISSFENIDRGDGIIPYREIDVPVAPDQPRTPVFKGYIISSHLDNEISGEGDIVFLDKGKTSGLEVGDVFQVLSDEPSKRAIGEIQVIALKTKTSSAIIRKSAQEIMIGSKWGGQ